MNLTLEQVYTCNATTEGDPDIAGLGVISSFVINAWITVFVAFIPAYYAFTEWWYRFKVVCRKKQWIIQLPPPRLVSDGSTSTALETSKALLGSLCDLQVLTGTAIVISAAAQMPKVSFYHESIAMNSWWLTLNSFWAARIEQFYDDAEAFAPRATLRRISVLVSVILGSALQVVIIRRENNEWDNNTKGRCYLYQDNSSTWPWVVGAVLYGLSLLLNIIPFSRRLLNGYTTGLARGQRRLNKWCLFTFERHEPALPQIGRKFVRGRPLLESRILHRGLSVVSVVLYFFAREFLALWSYGDGFYPLETVAYVGFATWNTFDVVSLKVLNKPLIVGGENKWGFGQVFPIIMIASTGFVTFDAILAAKEKMHRKKILRTNTL